MEESNDDGSCDMLSGPIVKITKAENGFVIESRVSKREVALNKTTLFEALERIFSR